MLNETTIDLATLTRSSGILTAKDKSKSKFVFRVANLPYDFWVYQVSRDYTVLDSKLLIGVPVTVYYKTASRTSSGNSIQAYQVEQNGQVVVDKSLLGGQNRNGGLIGLIGSIVLVGIIIWQFRKKAPVETA